ncbi:hypothetical protein M6B38_113275 [Iris pallida]|uniref:Uncharacterized protein n=1 Tax=Iris pallida TaxID=29817 RepID=A0AAX6IMZ6_IRIPA|nr:hypothetical protein M6B38_113275 [Iris pallida]
MIEIFGPNRSLNHRWTQEAVSNLWDLISVPASIFHIQVCSNSSNVG